MTSELTSIVYVYEATSDALFVVAAIDAFDLELPPYIYAATLFIVYTCTFILDPLSQS